MKEQYEEFTGHNTQADPEFLYAEDEMLVSEQTRDLYSDLETISVEPKKILPFLDNQQLENTMESKETSKVKGTPKMKFNGIKAGYRTTEIPNPEYSSHKRKSLALTRSVEIWKQRVEESQKLVDAIKKEDINTPAQSATAQETRKKHAKNVNQLLERETSLMELGEVPDALITVMTDVKVPAPELREWAAGVDAEKERQDILDKEGSNESKETV